VRCCSCRLGRKEEGKGSENSKTSMSRPSIIVRVTVFISIHEKDVK
jgi:hypothetical protein